MLLKAGTSVIMGEDIFLDFVVIVKGVFRMLLQRSRMFIVEVLGMPRCGEDEADRLKADGRWDSWKAAEERFAGLLFQPLLFVHLSLLQTGPHQTQRATIRISQLIPLLQ